MPAIQETGALFPVSERSPWRKGWLPTSVFLSEELHGQKSLVGYSPWDHEELDTTEWITLSLFTTDIYFLFMERPKQVFLVISSSPLSDKSGQKPSTLWPCHLL